jgi:hypothetical protein
MSEHACTPKTCPTGKYFVTAIDAGKVHYMAGPYSEHADALADVGDALRIANKHDGRAWFMAWGTVRAADDCQRIGQLNKYGLLKNRNHMPTLTEK